MDDQLTQAATETLKTFFSRAKDQQVTSSDVATARIASSVLSTHAREKQAAGAADALSFMIARELSADRTQLESFLVAAMPHTPIVRALPARES